MEEKIKKEEVKEVKSKKTNTKTDSPKDMLKYFGFGLLGILVIFLLISAVVSVRAVKNLSQNSFVLGMSKVLNLSVAEINGEKISYNDYVEDLKTLNKFYSNPPEGLTVPTSEEISDQVLSRLLANKLINKTAKEYGVKVTNEDITNFKDSLLTQFPSEAEANKELQDRYGWTLEKYIERVGKPILLEQKLQTAFSEKTLDSTDEFAVEEVRASHILFMEDEKTTKEQAKTKAKEVLQKIKDGADFAEMAAQYGVDSTKDEGGDLGWFSRGIMIPEFEEAIFAMEKGQLADDLVETSFGYHIVKLDDRRFVRDFYTYMNNQLMTAKIKINLPINNPFESLKQTQQTEPITIEVEDSEENTISE